MPRVPNPERTFDFNDRKLRVLQTPPAGKQVDYFDTKARGLGLRLSYGGRRSWFVMYSDAGGNRQRVSLGQYGKIEDGMVPLADARKRAKAKLGEVATGKSPAAERAAERVAPTVKALAADFVEHQKTRRRTWKKQESILNRDVLPKIGGMKARHVRRADVRAMLRKIAERPAPVLANRAHEISRRMFNWALDEEIYGIEYNPADRIERWEESSRDRWLTTEEIAVYWRELDAEPDRAATALRLLLLTAQRQQNVLAMRWSQIDWGDSVWTCPARETKTNETYIVPLSPIVIQILKGLKDDAEEGVDWVFKKRGADGPADRTFIAKSHTRACERAGIEGYVMHDDRHTFSTHSARMGIPEFIRSRVLHHSGGKTRSTQTNR